MHTEDKETKVKNEKSVVIYNGDGIWMYKKTGKEDKAESAWANSVLLHKILTSFFTFSDQTPLKSHFSQTFFSCYTKAVLWHTENCLCLKNEAKTGPFWWKKSRQKTGKLDQSWATADVILGV